MGGVNCFVLIFRFLSEFAGLSRVARQAAACASFAAAAGLILAPAAGAQRGQPGQSVDQATAINAVNDAFTWCTLSTSPAAAVHFCTLAIDSGIVSGATVSKPLALRGSAYFHEGDYQHALEDLNRAIAADLQNSAAFTSRGDVYLAMGDEASALRDYDGAINADPFSAEAFVKRGLAYKHQGEFERAVADYNRATRIDAKYAPAFFERAAAYAAQGDFAHALEESDKAVNLGTTAAAFASRGAVYRAQGDFARALADYDRAVQLSPDGADAYYGRGLVKAAQGQFAAARLDFARAVELRRANGGVETSLWLYVATARSGADGRDQLSLVPAQYDSSAWPDPIVQMLLEHIGPAAVLQAADARDTKATHQQDECQAHFFVGEYNLIRGGAASAARSELQSAASKCAADAPEASVAKAELARLKP